MMYSIDCQIRVLFVKIFLIKILFLKNVKCETSKIETKIVTEIFSRLPINLRFIAIGNKRYIL